MLAISILLVSFELIKETDAGRSIYRERREKVGRVRGKGASIERAERKGGGGGGGRVRGKHLPSIKVLMEYPVKCTAELQDIV